MARDKAMVRWALVASTWQAVLLTHLRQDRSLVTMSNSLLAMDRTRAETVLSASVVLTSLLCTRCLVHPSRDSPAAERGRAVTFHTACMAASLTVEAASFISKESCRH